ncbi:MAG: hypothetical protein RR248_02925 [Clostridia bacterium]
MFEATINATYANKNYLAYIKSQLKDKIIAVEGLLEQQDMLTRSYLSVACNDAFATQIKDILKDSVAEALSLGYKNEFFKEQLNIKKNTFLTNTLVNIMSIFDNNLDKKAIKQSINSLNNLSLEGLCDFRLQKLKGKWEEIIKLTNAYDIILNDKGILTEFILYLAQAVPTTNNSLTLTFTHDDYLLFSDKNKLLDKLTLFTQCTLEESIMYNIICNKPKSVVVVGQIDNLDADFVMLLNSLCIVKKVGS